MFLCTLLAVDSDGNEIGGMLLRSSGPCIKLFRVCGLEYVHVERIKLCVREGNICRTYGRHFLVHRGYLERIVRSGYVMAEYAAEGQYLRLG